MNAQHIVEFVSDISLLIGILMIVAGMTLPSGWTSALGLLSLGLGIITCICSFLTMPDGRTYVYHMLMEVVVGKPSSY